MKKVTVAPKGMGLNDFVAKEEPAPWPPVTWMLPPPEVIRELGPVTKTP